MALALCAAAAGSLGSASAAGSQTGGVTLIESAASRAVPQTVWFQGFLADSASGEPITGQYDITAEIFEAAEEGTPLWGPETHTMTPVTDGWFNIELGLIEPPLPSFDSPPYYLQLTIGDETLEPRQKLASVPAALRASQADEPDADWTISGGDIYRLDGNIGVGLSEPTARLDVSAPEWAAVRGVSSGTDGTFYGLYGEASGVGSVYGVFGAAAGTGSVFGVAGSSDYVGVTGRNDVSGAYGELGTEAAGIHGSAGYQSGALAGQFDGSVHVSDTLAVGTATPQSELDVAGTARMTGLQLPTGAASGLVLTSDADGVGTWQTVSAGGLTLPYVGSTNTTDSAFRVENTSPGVVSSAVAGYHTSTGNYGHLGGAGAAVRGVGPSGLAGEFEGDVLVTERLGVGGVPTLGRFGVFAGGQHGNAIYVYQAATSGATMGIYAAAESPDGAAVYGESNADTSGVGVQGVAAHEGGVGVRGVASGPGSAGVLGEGEYHGVRGVCTSGGGGEGILGVGGTGVYGRGGGGGLAGNFAGNVYVSDWLGVGATPYHPLHVVGQGGKVLYAKAEVLDTNPHYAIYGETPSYDGYGVYGFSPFVGVAGKNSDTGVIGRLGYDGSGVYGYDGGDGSRWAGRFSGRVYASGDVGVGVDPPEARLDVGGVARIRGAGWPDPDTGASMELAYNSGSHRGYIQVYDRQSGGLGWGQLYLGAGPVGIGASIDYLHLLEVGGTVECETLYETNPAPQRQGVRELEDALDAIDQLRGVVFTSEIASDPAAPGRQSKRIGVLAEELESVFPELVSGEGASRSVNYSRLTAVLIQAVKELRAENEALAARVDALEAR
jgi:hypothetical protein